MSQNTFQQFSKMEFFKNCSESSDSSRKLKISKSIFSHTKWVKTLVKISEIEFFKKCSKWSDLARKLEIFMCKFKLLENNWPAIFRGTPGNWEHP